MADNDFKLFLRNVSLRYRTQGFFKTKFFKEGFEKHIDNVGNLIDLLNLFNGTLNIYEIYDSLKPFLKPLLRENKFFIQFVGSKATCVYHFTQSSLFQSILQEKSVDDFVSIFHSCGHNYPLAFLSSAILPKITGEDIRFVIPFISTFSVLHNEYLVHAYSAALRKGLEDLIKHPENYPLDTFKNNACSRVISIAARMLKFPINQFPKALQPQHFDELLPLANTGIIGDWSEFAHLVGLPDLIKAGESPDSQALIEHLSQAQCLLDGGSSEEFINLLKAYELDYWGYLFSIVKIENVLPAHGSLRAWYKEMRTEAQIQFLNGVVAHFAADKWPESWVDDIALIYSDLESIEVPHEEKARKIQVLLLEYLVSNQNLHAKISQRWSSLGLPQLRSMLSKASPLLQMQLIQLMPHQNQLLDVLDVNVQAQLLVMNPQWIYNKEALFKSLVNNARVSLVNQNDLFMAHFSQQPLALMHYDINRLIRILGKAALNNKEELANIIAPTPVEVLKKIHDLTAVSLEKALSAKNCLNSDPKTVEAVIASCVVILAVIGVIAGFTLFCVFVNPLLFNVFMLPGVLLIDFLTAIGIAFADALGAVLIGALVTGIWEACDWLYTNHFNTQLQEITNQFGDVEAMSALHDELSKINFPEPVLESASGFRFFSSKPESSASTASAGFTPACQIEPSPSLRTK